MTVQKLRELLANENGDDEVYFEYYSTGDEMEGERECDIRDIKHDVKCVILF